VVLIIELRIFEPYMIYKVYIFLGKDESGKKEILEDGE
jgi:hypothetical protein